MNHYSSSEQMQANTLERVQTTTASYNNYVSEWLTSKGDILSSMPSQPPHALINPLLNIIKTSGGFDNIFMVYEDGSQQNANDVVLPAGNDDPRQWGWYIHSKGSNQVFMDTPTISAATGALVLSLGREMNFYQQKVVMGADIPMAGLLTSLNNFIMPGDGQIFLANRKGVIIAHADTSKINQSIDVLGLSTSIMAQNRDAYQALTINGIEAHLYTAPIEGTDLMTISIIHDEALMADMNQSSISQAFFALIMILMMNILSYSLISKFIQPLTRVSKALSEIANGGGNLTQRLTVDSDDEIGQLSNSFNQFVGSLSELIQQIKAQSLELNQLAQKSQTRTQEASQVINAQQNEVTLVATAISEMNSVSIEIARNSEEAADSAQKSLDISISGLSTVQKSINSINSLSNEIKETEGVFQTLTEYVQEINGILSAIQNIADQTNLLALNAAIEAARAGDAGRGFAVVADEVRMLSQKTQESTIEIQRTIETFEGIVSQAAKLMHNSSNLANSTVQNSEDVSMAFSNINDSIKLISEMSGQIAAAVESQTSVSNEISSNIERIKQVSDELAINSQNTLTDTQALNQQSTQLSNKVSAFVV